MCFLFKGIYFVVHAVPSRGQWNFLFIYLTFYCTVYIKDNKVILFLKFWLVSKLFVSHLWYQIKIRNMWIMMFWSNLLHLCILSESVKKWYFNQLCLPDLKYRKLLSWQYLPSWAKIQKNWYLTNFATVGKSMGNYCFDHICHPEQNWE